VPQVRTIVRKPLSATRTGLMMMKFKKVPKTYLHKALIIVPSIILLVFAFAFVTKTIASRIKKGGPMSANTSNSQDTFLVLRNSGSTNFPGFTITVKHDGSGTLTYESRPGDTRPQFNIANKTFPPQTFQIARVRQILSQIGTINKNIPNHSCMKSVSFGSSVTITYNGQTSGDISCIDSTDPQTYQHLKDEIDTLMSQAIR
jgi:hypothetical protein